MEGWTEGLSHGAPKFSNFCGVELFFQQVFVPEVNRVVLGQVLFVKTIHINSEGIPHPNILLQHL